MKTAETLLNMLGLRVYTPRHIRVVNEFLKSGESDVRVLLDQLGTWDECDLAQAEKWMKINKTPEGGEK